MISDYLYRNKFVKDVMDTMKQLVETILDDCSNEPKALSTPIVRYIYIYI